MNALTRANSLAQAWWEEKAQEGIVDGKFNAKPPLIGMINTQASLGALKHH